jgi:hypothetical protein
VIHQSFKSLFTDSSHVKFGCPLPLFSLPDRLITPLQTGASVGLRWICPNHLKRCCTSFSSTGATPSLLRMSSFRTRSLLVLPQIYRSMRISATIRDYYCYKFQKRPGIFNPILYVKRLFQQFTIDTYIKIESNRLEYISKHQTQLRADLYQGLLDSLMEGETRGAQTGK